MTHPVFQKMYKILTVSFILVSLSFSFQFQNYLPNQTILSMKLISDNLWLGTENGIVVINDQGIIQHEFNDSNGFPAVGNVYNVARDLDSVIWASTSAGLCFFKDNSWSIYKMDDGLIDNVVRVVVVDKLNRKWIGTYRGVSLYDGTTWTSFTVDDSLPHNYITSGAIDKNGTVWMGTKNGLAFFNGTDWTQIFFDEKNPSYAVENISFDYANSIWLCASFVLNVGKYGGFVLIPKGVYKPIGNLWECLTESNGLLSRGVELVFHEENGRIWFGTNVGLNLFSNNKWSLFTTTDGLPGDFIYSIAADRQGNIWFGTNNGVSKLIEHTDIQSVTEKQNAGLNCKVVNNTIMFNTVFTNLICEAFTADGKKVFAKKYQKSPEAISLEVSSGVYLISITSFEGKMLRKIIVNR